MRGSIGKRDGKHGPSWFYRIDLGHDPSGKRRQKTRRGFPTRKAATEAMQRELHERRAGTYFEPSREPLGAYLDRWRTSTAHRRRPGTTYAYGISLKRLPPSLLDLPLKDVTPLAIQEAEQAMLTRYAVGSVRNTHDVLKMALRQAVRWRLLLANPCDGVDAPRLSRAKLKTWSAQETRRFLAAAFDQPSFALWRLLLDSGMRISEAQALRWSDVDLVAQTVTIRRTMTRDAEGREVVGEEAKTTAGQRTIEISHETARELEIHQRQQAARRAEAGPYWRELDLVFDGGDGGPFAKQTIARRLDEAIARAGVPRLTPHGLRHTSATLLILAGVPVKVVSQRLGHSSVAITLDRYVHPDGVADRQAADVVSRLLDEPL